MSIAILPPPPRQTANPAPIRPANSVRRTSSIDVSWPDGDMADRLFVGRARDYLTPASGGPGRTLAEAEFRARLAADKTITSIEANPAPPRLGELVGARGGNHLRLFLREAMPELIEQGAPIYLPLDDLSGTALVSTFAWAQWQDNWAEGVRGRMTPEEIEEMNRARINVCWGLQEGNSGVAIASGQGSTHDVVSADAGELRNPTDPQGWHEFPENEGAGFRRARRIDVTRDGDLIRVDAAFQDAAKRRTGGRLAVHEYDIEATVDARTLELLTLEPKARILPFSECPGAVHNTRRLIGSSLPEIRDTVLTNLRGPEGCTHLNDALRALAEVPKLAQYLETQPA